MIDLEEEINENNPETNNPQERGSINQAIKEEVSEKTIFNKGIEEEIQNPNSQSDTSSSATAFRKHSVDHPVIQGSQRSRPSIGQYSLRSPKSLQEQPTSEVDTKEGKVLLSRRTGKELQHKHNQTSFIWERKPLSEILQPSGEKSKINEERHATKEEVRPVKGFLQVPTKEDNDKPSFHEFFEDFPIMAGQDSQNDSQPPLDLNCQQLVTNGSELSTPTMAEDVTSPEVQLEQVESMLSVEHQPKEAVKGQVSVNQRTGKEVRSCSNQTSRIWERKPLAQILQRSSPEGNQKAEHKEYFFHWPSPYDY